MNTFRFAAGYSIHRSGKQSLVYVLLWAVCVPISPQGLLASHDQNAPPPPQDAQQSPGQRPKDSDRRHYRQFSPISCPSFAAQKRENLG
jgi:hypothetical protein